MEKERIQFPKGKQKEFIADAKKSFGTSWKKAGDQFGINNNTFQTYWKEKTRVSKSDFAKICQVLQVNLNTLLEKYGARVIIWNYPAQITCVGYKNFKKVKTKISGYLCSYANNEVAFDVSKIKFSKRDCEKQIKLPKEITPLLAEEIGLSIGDGVISGKKFEYRLKGNKLDEKDYYTTFIKPMFKELYNLELNIKEYESTVGFEVYSQALWEFKTKIIGLPTAPKKTIRIPNCLKVNDKEVVCALIRGLLDTDGSIYFRSQGRNKKYYPVISFATISRGLASDVKEILGVIGFRPRLYSTNKITISRPNPCFTVVLYGYSNFELYKKLINTRQPKNITKLKTWGDKFGK